MDTEYVLVLPTEKGKYTHAKFDFILWMKQINPILLQLEISHIYQAKLGGPENKSPGSSSQRLLVLDQEDVEVNSNNRGEGPDDQATCEQFPMSLNLTSSISLSSKRPDENHGNQLALSPPSFCTLQELVGSCLVYATLSMFYNMGWLEADPLFYILKFVPLNEAY